MSLLVWFGRKGGEGREMENFPFSLDALPFFSSQIGRKLMDKEGERLFNIWLGLIVVMYPNYGGNL